MRSSTVLGLALFLGAAACGAHSTKTTGGSSTSSGTSSGTGGGGGGDLVQRTTPNPAFLPAATGPCPDFKAGKLPFSPDGNARNAQIWVSAAAAAKHGPIIFFWHGAGGSPTDALVGIGTKEISEIEAAGGIVAAPYSIATEGNLPWALALGGTDESDLRLMDEVLACAIAKVGVDLRHIHSVGFSAGAMNTMQAGDRRSGYLASLVSYSGAELGVVPVQDPSNRYAAMLFDGGPTDDVIVNFQSQTETYESNLQSNGHFAFICDHNMGHTIPSDGPPSAWQFLQDHPFGVQPEPYAKALPTGFPSYCSL